MFAGHRILFLSIAVLMAAAAWADEYGRGSGGELRMFTKQPSTLSASLGLRFGFDKALEGSVGGTLLEDRMWFFASAAQYEAQQFATPVPQTNVGPSIIDAKLIAPFDARQLLSASYGQTQNPLAGSDSFLSLRYSAILSDKMFFTASASSSR